MAKGTQSKQEITKKLLEIFPGSFLYNSGKEIRIPMEEDGEQVQIKIALTCAKVNVQIGDDVAIPTASTTPQSTEITEQEKKEVRNIIAELNL